MFYNEKKLSSQQFKELVIQMSGALKILKFFIKLLVDQNVRQRTYIVYYWTQIDQIGPRNWFL